MDNILFDLYMDDNDPHSIYFGLAVREFGLPFDWMWAVWRHSFPLEADEVLDSDQAFDTDWDGVFHRIDTELRNFMHTAAERGVSEIL